MPAPSFWESILAHLKQPEYIHVLLNPLPIYGLALGAIALILAMCLKSRPTQITALVLNVLTLLLTIADFGLTAWIGYAGGQAMHKEFRSGMPSEPVGGYDKMR